MMPVRRGSRLVLGPIVGHTTESTSAIWIQVVGDPQQFELRVQGAGIFQFVSTEVAGVPEFGTAIAVADGLRADWQYSYSIMRRGRVISGARGSFRTMPPPGSLANILFCPVSCNSAESIGMWDALRRFVDEAKPHFLLMMGDQVYIDEDDPDVFEEHFESPPTVRRKALADKIQLNWSREQVQHVLSHVPTYMMWDDHEIRDGWGSLACDSPTLVQKFPRGQAMFDQCDSYFRDARDVYWHFQACRNPPLELPFEGPPFTARQAMPFVFLCGRVLVLMLDSRGQRDVFRDELPILGEEQWEFVDQLFANLSADVDAIVVMTPTPIASMDPHGSSQKLVGGRTDDIEAFKKGDIDNVLHPKSTKEAGDLLQAVAGSYASRVVGRPVNLGNFKVANVDEARDQWSHKFARPEQQRLLSAAAHARSSNRPPAMPRALLFVSGDIHVGALFDIEMSDPKCRFASITASGISTFEDPVPTVGAIVDEEFKVATGIHSKLRDVVTEFNFGVVQVVPTGAGAEIFPSIAHEENGLTVGIDLSKIL